MYQNLLNNVEIVRVANRGAGAASATPTKATILDMQGFDGALFIAAFDNVVDTSAIALKIAGSDTNSTGTMALLTGAEAGITADATSGDNKLIAVDVYKPSQRYLEAQVFHVTANAPFDGVIAIKYRGRLQPVTQGATVVASASAPGQA